MITVERPPTERRIETRFEVRIAARIAHANGSGCHAEIHNISLSGLLVRIAEADAARLLPNVKREMRNIPVTLELEFAAGAALIRVQCGVAHLRRVAAGCCDLGLGFRAFGPGSAEALARHCASLTPAR